MADTTKALQQLNETPNLPEAVDAALAQGDMAKLSPEHRVEFYKAICLSAGLNPLTRPFDLMKNQAGQLVPYARKEAAEQLRKIHNISVRTLSREWIDEELYCVEVEASTADGRVEQAQGIVPIKGKGEAKANGMMKAETKAKRRVTLAICGLGFPDADESTSFTREVMDPVTGEIIGGEIRQLPAPQVTHEEAMELFGVEADEARADEVKPSSELVPPVYNELLELMKAYGMTGTQVQDRLIAVNKEYRTVRELELTEARQMIRDITEEYETKAAKEG